MELIIVTGASKGFGRGIALEYANRCKDTKVHIVLTARSLTEMGAVKAEMLRINNQLKISCLVMDLSDIAGSRDTMSQHADRWIETGKCKQVTIIHNAGSLGPLVRITDLHKADVKFMEQTVNLNYVSFMMLTSLLLDKCLACQVEVLRLVNISSLAAIQSFDTWSVYGSLKSAREHFVRHLIEEQQSNFSSTISVVKLNSMHSYA